MCERIRLIWSNRSLSAGLQHLQRKERSDVMLFYAHRNGMDSSSFVCMCVHVANRWLKIKKIQICLRDIIENPSLFIKFRDSIRQNEYMILYLVVCKRLFPHLVRYSGAFQPFHVIHWGREKAKKRKRTKCIQCSFSFIWHNSPKNKSYSSHLNFVERWWTKKLKQLQLLTLAVVDWWFYWIKMNAKFQKCIFSFAYGDFCHFCDGLRPQHAKHIYPM